jgi:hypothetical protein
MGLGSEIRKKRHRIPDPDPQHCLKGWVALLGCITLFCRTEKTGSLATLQRSTKSWAIFCAAQRSVPREGVNGARTSRARSAPESCRYKPFWYRIFLFLQYMITAPNPCPSTCRNVGCDTLWRRTPRSRNSSQRTPHAWRCPASESRSFHRANQSRRKRARAPEPLVELRRRTRRPFPRISRRSTAKLVSSVSGAGSCSQLFSP